MSWGSIIVSALQIITTLLTWFKQKQWIKAGEDAAIARAALKTLEATEEGQRLYTLVSSLDEVEADDLWKRMIENDRS